MIKRIGIFLGITFIVSILIIAQTTLSNFIWLIQADMPVTLVMIVTKLFEDILRMMVIVFPIIFIVNLIFFLVAMIVSRYTALNKKRAYALSGGLGLFLISVGIPFLAGGIYGLTGARSVIGKITFTLIGLLGGFLFGKHLDKSKLETS
tara:strand:+ start:587 stop:1033 length:447 start_codon:yes stop_codon:yes gene_type:complete